MRCRCDVERNSVCRIARMATKSHSSATLQNLRFVALLWEMFVNEVRWFWDQGIPLPRMPAPHGDANDDPRVDLDCCLIYQKLQVRAGVKSVWRNREKAY